MDLLIPLPNKVTYEKLKSNNEARLIIEPCFKGYGTTVGNALRRVLLSSIPGAAVTAIKVKGVDHEFSTIPNVKEDLIEIILNFKQLRLKLHTDEEVRLKLEVSGEKEVTASDIEDNPDVEIVNKDLKLFTTTDSKTKVEMEILVNKGVGYVPTEAREKEKTEVGMIAIDSIYTPIKNVGYKVENVRVGQMTNYEKVLIDIETDGTLDPKEAVKYSANLLINHFKLLIDDQPKSEEQPMEESLEQKVDEEE